MITRLKTTGMQLLQSPKRFPVEFALGVVFFIISVWYTESYTWNDLTGQARSDIDDTILAFFIPLVALTFWLRGINKWAYWASFFLFLPLMMLDLKPFLWTYGYGFTHLLAFLLLVLGHRTLNNRSFVSHSLHVVTQLFLGLFLVLVFWLAVLAVTSSFFYIFGIDTPRNFYYYVLQFIWLILAPQVCCTLISQHEYEVLQPAKVLKIMLNFILSPAVVIYTVILYAYFVKIVIDGNLPKGGVAWMVMGFIAVALAGRMVQSVLSQRYYDWFYRFFTFIAIPPLIMYWVGSMYRIRLYGFTEGRCYLMVAGVLMTLFVGMLLWKRTRRFQLMALIFGVAIILFTYIPGMSAKSIGLRSQEHRLQEIADNLQLKDAKTGKLRTDIDVEAVNRDSLLCERYKDAASVIDYVCEEMGDDAFKRQYGAWPHSKYTFRYDAGEAVKVWYNREVPVELGEYNIMLPKDAYEAHFDGQLFTVSLKDSSAVVEYPIASVVKGDTALLHRPAQLFTCRNDSLLLVLGSVCVNGSAVAEVSTYNYQLFRRASR